VGQVAGTSERGSQKRERAREKEKKAVTPLFL